jgi:hypothetical protein
MTTTELVAGRELDALVAERVMGWQVDTDKEGYWCNDAGWTGWLVPESEADARYEQDRCWRPSTDITAAWQVVEHIKEREGCGFFVAWNKPEYGRPAHWSAGFIEAGNDGHGHDYTAEVEADTAQLAICKAALAAVGKP